MLQLSHLRLDRYTVYRLYSIWMSGNYLTVRRRLDSRAYYGCVSVVFTACIDNRLPAFACESTTRCCIEILETSIAANHCIVPLFCFMPDHLHIVLQGASEFADVQRAFRLFKQRSGFWLINNLDNIRWQKSYFDHIIRVGEDYDAQLRYILENPVRRGLCDDPRDYHGVGCLGTTINQVFRL